MGPCICRCALLPGWCRGCACQGLFKAGPSCLQLWAVPAPLFLLWLLLLLAEGADPSANSLLLEL